MRHTITLLALLGMLATSCDMFNSDEEDPKPGVLFGIGGLAEDADSFTVEAVTDSIRVTNHSDVEIYFVMVSGINGPLIDIDFSNFYDAGIQPGTTLTYSYEDIIIAYVEEDTEAWIYYADRQQRIEGSGTVPLK